MVLGDRRRTRDRFVPAPARIIPVLLYIVLLPFALSALQSERQPDQQIVRSPISADAALLLGSYWPDYREGNAGPEIAMGDLVDSFIDWKSASSPNSTSIADYAVARARGSDWKGVTPEDTSRRLFTLADEIVREGTDAVRSEGVPMDTNARNALVLLVRYHARKILCGTNLAVFYRSGDASALDAAISHASAGLALWERMVRLADAPEATSALIATAGVNRCKDSLSFVRHDIMRLEEVRQVFERFGLFDRGLDFGPPAVQGRGLRENSRARSYNLERRFLPLEPGMTYLQPRGYGWLDTDGISSSPAVPLPDFTLRESRSNPIQLPSDALTRDFLRGRAKSTLLLDLPDGFYRVTAILANQAELASGSFLIRALEKDAPAGSISYTAGETGDKSVDVAVVGGKLALEFVPEPGKDWLLNGLIVTRRSPHIGHVPVLAASPASATTFTATITAPDGTYSAHLHLAVKDRVSNIPMVQDGTQFTGQVHWLPTWGGAEATYYITALDRAGHATRWPPVGAVRVRILAKDAAEHRRGRATNHLLIQSPVPCNPSR